jgi:hypothetical protein
LFVIFGSTRPQLLVPIGAFRKSVDLQNYLLQLDPKLMIAEWIVSNKLKKKDFMNKLQMELDSLNSPETQNNNNNNNINNIISNTNNCNCCCHCCYCSGCYQTPTNSSSNYAPVHTSSYIPPSSNNFY